LQFFIKQPGHIMNKYAFEKIYGEILDNNKKSMQDFHQKILFATEPIYILWKTLQKIRNSLGSLYNYSDNYFKLIIQQTVSDLFSLSVNFNTNSSKKEVQNVTENLIMRLMHKIMGGLRKDHKILFMFVFCVTLLENENSDFNPAKSKILEKINFIFNGIQIYQGDLLAMDN
jgi:hypothetical protein